VITDYFSSLKEVFLKDLVQGVIREIEEKNLIGTLQQCGSCAEREIKLMELLPEIQQWKPKLIEDLFSFLQKEKNLDFGICSFCEIENGKRFCVMEGERVECILNLPEL
jgi:uncharacterized protein YuzB (UPF0349 family)